MLPELCTRRVCGTCKLVPAKSIIINVINPQKHKLIKQIGRQPKNDKRVLVCYMEQNLYDNHKTLIIKSKLNIAFSRQAIRQYLKTEKFFRFKEANNYNLLNRSAKRLLKLN